MLWEFLRTSFENSENVFSPSFNPGWTAVKEYSQNLWCAHILCGHEDAIVQQSTSKARKQARKFMCSKDYYILLS